MSSRPIRKLLVANRGEIACRVFRTCRAHGIGTVAIYSDVDRRALHVAEADQAVGIGGAAARDSYLDVAKIIDAARRSGADAIHPGYGFVSEKPHVARACEAAGLCFVGPPAGAMEVMGDKVRSRQTMMAAGVPVVPGREDIRDSTEAVAAARDIGFPIMLKASAGGGGKGMRVVHRVEDVERSFSASQREAAAAFGDDRVFLERAVLSARHVEIQVMADSHGNVVCLHERDCSVQRRHQKVIEEAPCPSPVMSPRVREEMARVAAAAARAVDYRGAGTVEFLFEEAADGPRFYFLEMNTRLQVEHPVTEAITGRDLVWDQLRVAMGHPLGYAAADVPLSGHAIECRVYAEDPERFLPSPGIVGDVHWPRGPGVRVDAGVEPGCDVSAEYDPMVAKIVAWGPTREVAIARMRQAIADTSITGVRTNLQFHARVLAEPDFRSGRFDTGYIAAHPDLVRPASLDEGSSQAVAAAAVAHALSIHPTTAAIARGSQGWRHAVRWRA
ncbi:MAG: ATP-grasp domain-containing protein [Myxococcales bacterium FL481]|nr:MAG: ATP-grasp domain-containing protein [Myxococcales bacterium FL481]